MNNETDAWRKIDWVFYVLFFAIGVLNVILIHPAAGAFYILLTFIYFPPTNTMLNRKFGFALPPIIKITLAIIVLWATLAVSDLMELFEAWLLP